MKKFIAIFACIILFGCGVHQHDSVQGKSWKFQQPPNWIFVHLGYDRKTILVGNSLMNVGRRPMVVALSKSCDEKKTSEEKSSEIIGTATKWVGGRLGYFRASKDESNVLYRATVPEDRCSWTFVCTGDVIRFDEVVSTCDMMFSSLEFR